MSAYTLIEAGGPHELVPDPYKTQPHRQRCRHCMLVLRTRGEVAQHDPNEMCHRRLPRTVGASFHGINAKITYLPGGHAHVEWALPGGYEFECDVDERLWSVEDWARGVADGLWGMLHSGQEIDLRYIDALEQQQEADEVLPANVVAFRPRLP